jgi:hypothetical protein
MWCGIFTLGLAGCDAMTTAPAERARPAAVRRSITAAIDSAPGLVLSHAGGLELGSGALLVGQSARVAVELQDRTGALVPVAAPVFQIVRQQGDRRGGQVAVVDSASGTLRGVAAGWVQLQARAENLISYSVFVRVNTAAAVPAAPAAAGMSVVSAAGARCLEPRFGARTGVLATVALCAAAAPRQAWTVPEVGQTGPVSVYGGTMCLDAYNGQGRAGTPVGTWACGTGAVNQQWTRTTGGELRGQSGLCLTVAEGTPPDVSLQRCTGARGQKWAAGNAGDVVRAPVEIEVPLPSAPTLAQVALPGASAIPSVSGLGCLQPKGGSSDQVPTEVVPCRAGVPAQQWQLPAVGTRGTVKVAGGTLCLDVSGGRALAHSPIGMWACAPNYEGQIWTVTSAGELRGLGGMCATVVGGTPPAVTLQDCQGTAAQRWAITGTSAAGQFPNTETAQGGAPTGQLQSTDVPLGGAGSVPVSLRRFDGADTAVVVSNSIPLVPGALWPGQERRVRLVLGSGQGVVEQGLYATPLASRHPDGSLRAVLVQFSIQMRATDTFAGRVELAVGDRPAALTLAAPLRAASGVPAAAVLPTSAEYLIRTDLVGKTIPAARAAHLGAAFARYESDFAGYADPAWANAGSKWNDGNYYDRALIYYAWWARTGNPQYWWRAARFAVDYRAGYLEAEAGYASSPHWAQLEGLEKHYLLTGDEASRVARPPGQPGVRQLLPNVLHPRGWRVAHPGPFPPLRAAVLAPDAGRAGRGGRAGARLGCPGRVLLGQGCCVAAAQRQLPGEGGVRRAAELHGRHAQ